MAARVADAPHDQPAGLRALDNIHRRTCIDQRIGEFSYYKLIKENVKSSCKMVNTLKNSNDMIISSGSSRKRQDVFLTKRNTYIHVAYFFPNSLDADYMLIHIL